MISKIKNKAKEYLLWSQRYTNVDMLYIGVNSAWTSFNFVITSAFSLLLVITFANLLPKETYGNYRYIMSLSGAIAFFTLTGMNTAVTQAVARGQDGIIKYALRVQLKWNLLFTTASAIISAYYFVNNNSLFAISILIIGLAFPFTTAFNTYGAFLAGKKDFKQLSIWSTATSIIYSTSMILTLILTRNLIILVTVYALANALPVIYIYFLTIRKYRPGGYESGEEQKLFNYGAHLSFINIFGNLSQYVDKIVIFHFLGAVELAIYGLALSVPERLRGFAKSITSIMLPKLANKDIREIEKVFYKRVFQSMAMGALISVSYILISPILFKLFLPKYLESIRYSQVISLYFITNLPAAYMASVFNAQKMLRTLYLSSMTAHISRIVLFILFGYLWGIWGVIYAMLLVNFVGIFYNLILWEIGVKQHLKLMVTSDVDKQTLPE